MMAATVGPDMPMDHLSSTTSSMTQQLGDPRSDAMAMDSLDGVAPTHLSAPRSSPPPNPPFVFPAKPASSSAPSSYSRASGRRPKSFADAAHLGITIIPEPERRQARSPALPAFSFNPGAQSPSLPDVSSGSNVTATRLADLPALPDFQFNPGAGLTPPSDHPFLSPPQSPLSPRAIPVRPGGHGHKRGGSEFVGGQIRSGDAITVISTSPTKSESGFASPQLKPVNPRRGHAHRRSAAISSHDLSMILKPLSPQPRGSSAPSSPAAFDRNGDYSFPRPDEQTDQKNETVAPLVGDAVQTAKVPEPEAVQDDEVKPPARPANRARVGFSDTLEFIPRPLSLVSSDTSSTVTARPGHSLSGSISSIISLPSSIIYEREMQTITPSPPRNATDPRPSTAGAVLERSQSPTVVGETRRSPQRRNSIPLLNVAALTAPTSPDTPSPSKAPKRWSFFGLEPFTGSTSPTRTRPLSSSSSEANPKHATSQPSSSDEQDAELKSCPHLEEEEEGEEGEEEASQKPSTNRKSKKKKKVKTWAGSILTRKSKHRQGKKSASRRSQTPPPSAALDVEDDDSEDAGEAVTEATTPSPAAMDSMDSPDALVGEAEAWTPRPATPEDDTPYPVIDLDAALGPFNTPLPRNAEWEAAQRASGLSKRPLHSAARLSGFTGPGMHYQHRRAESAPEMPPFNRAGIPRYSSNSTMADVFEEDEEDEPKRSGSEQGKAGKSSMHDVATVAKEARSASINICVTDSSNAPVDKAMVIVDADDDAVSSAALSRKGSGLSGLSDDERTPHSTCPKSDYSASSLHDEIIIEEATDMSWRGTESSFPMHDNRDRGDGSSSTTPSPRRPFKGKDLAPVDVSPLHLPTPSLAPISPYMMSQSSAFPSPRSPISYDDANRISTAPSSVTEDNFQSLLMGEPGPEVRLSMDIPSLTSSNSTMTRESAYVQSVQQLSQAPVRGERPASFSSPFGRRGSLASIGRLISTSHGERSKLSMEVSLEAEPEKKAKPSKTKRLSRLVQFWKPKESSSA